jgi:hypothetical protein
MEKLPVKNIDDYLAYQPEKVRGTLENGNLCNV